MKKGKAKTQFKRAMVSLLTAALVASGSFGLTTITSSASVADVDLSDPLKFSVYTNTYTNSNHVEGNVAIGSLQASLDIWEGKSYIGDFANANASFKCNVRDAIVAAADTNSDGTFNVITALPGQGYKFSVMSNAVSEDAEEATENVVREFITDNKMIGYEVRTDIASRISTVINACKNTSNELYALEDVETDNLLVLNISAADFNANGGEYDKLITESANAGKTVVVNVSDSGSVAFYYSMNATTVGGGLGHQPWAGNIVWNFGNASSVSVGGMFGTILAPSASVTNNANIVGAVIANSFAQGGEVHQVNYTRGIPTPPPKETPEPTPTPEVTPTPPVETPPVETPTPTPPVETPTPTPPVETPTPTPPAETPTPTPPAETPTPTPPVETPTPTPPAETPTPTPPVETPTPTPPVETPTPPAETPTPTPPVETPTPTPPVETPTPTPPVETPTPTPPVETPTPTPPVETPTPTPPVETPTPTPPVETPTPTPPVETPTPTPPVSTPTPTPPATTPTPPPAATPTPTPEVTPTPTPTPSEDPTPVPTPENVPTPTPEEPEVQGTRRFVVIEDEDTPLADAAVLGADRRPQTGDASDIWTIAFLASVSGLAAWILQGKKK